MNKDNAKDYLPLVQAMADGKTIQLKAGDAGWDDISETKFNFDPSEYRIKPEPREIWVNRYPDGSEFGRYTSRDEAQSKASIGAVQVCWREVIE